MAEIAKMTQEAADYEFKLLLAITNATHQLEGELFGRDVCADDALRFEEICQQLSKIINKKEFDPRPRLRKVKKAVADGDTKKVVKNLDTFLGDLMGLWGFGSF